MIAVEVIGGLGNQLFQYAAGLSLANSHNTELSIDSSQFESYETHPFELKSTCASLNELNKDLYSIDETSGRLKKLLLHSLANNPHKHKLDIYQESDFSYNPKFAKLPNNTYLKGYFQSEKYFLKDRQQIIEEYKPKKNGSFVMKLSRQIAQNTSISLHIRRGDYISNPVANEYHGSLQAEYYKKALSIMKDKYSKAIIYVFSDDISWCKQNLIIHQKVIWVEGSHSAIEGIHLMSLCDHNIIANSSFSWWGAWLNQNSQKTVIGPKKWFAHENSDTRDILPSAWHVI